MASTAMANEEAIRAWDGVLFDRFVEFREVIVDGLQAHGEAAMRLYPPPEGAHVLDIGCGFGDTTRRVAELAGPGGSAVGVDAAPRFIDAARAEAEAAGAENVSFLVADVQAEPFAERFDHAFSRMGTMFFANPVAALRNVREALAPGARLVMVVWRQKADNDWLYRAEQVVGQFVEEDDDSEEPTCGPGPFSMAGADTTSGILLSAGFEDVAFHRRDIPFKVGRDLDRAVEYVLALGPAGEVMRLAGEDAVRLRPKIEAAMRELLTEWETPDGVWAPASSWIVTATAPVA